MNQTFLLNALLRYSYFPVQKKIGANCLRFYHPLI